MKSQRIEFTGSQGAPLAGLLEQPDKTPRGWALFAHCFTCSKDSKAAFHISRMLAEAGFGVLRFDFTGLGGSGGDFANTNFTSNVDDLVAAADWLRENYGIPALLIGHSLGGAAVLTAAHRVPDSAAIVTIGAPFDPSHVSKNFGESVAEIEREGVAKVLLGGRNFTVKREFLEDLHSQNQAERIHKLHRPLMILHAPRDMTVGIDNAGEIFSAAMHPKSFVSLDDADHLLSHQKDARFAAQIIAAWAGRYLNNDAENSPSKDEQNQSDSVYVSEYRKGKYAVKIRSGRHSWLADEPIKVGGDDLGPSPYDMLCAALGACTVMTLRMYADYKKWALKNTQVTLTHEKIHTEDCAESETESGYIDHIERQIYIEGDLEDAQKTRLLEIANRCPVHRTLHSKIHITTTQI